MVSFNGQHVCGAGWVFGAAVVALVRAVAAGGGGGGVLLLVGVCGACSRIFCWY